jgi:hypothetical protein
MEIDENGVVNPLRVPAAVRALVRAIATLPPLALAFAGLAVVVFAIGIVWRHGFAPILVGEALVVLYPTAVLWRRRDAAAATPDLFLGAVLVSASQIGSTAARILSSMAVSLLGANPLTTDPLRAAVSIALGLMAAAGWWLVARSLAAQAPLAGDGRRIVAIVVAGCALATALAQVLVFLLAPNADLGTLLIILIASVPAQIVMARLGWVAVTRAGIAPRPASWTAAVGASAQAAGLLPLFMIALVLLVNHDEAWVQAQTVGITIQTVAFVVAPILFALAFALGVGDATGAPRARASAARPAR